MLPTNSLIPLHDENPTQRTAYVTIFLIIANILIFFLLEPNLGQIPQCSNQDANCQQQQLKVAGFLCKWGTVPNQVTSKPAEDPKICSLFPHRVRSSLLGLITNVFLHGGLLHLGGNMLFLWIFGNNIEDVLGKFRYVIFYLLSGALASLTHVLGNPHADVPAIGASGAIAAVLGAYIVLFPKARVTTLIPLGFIFFTRRIPAVVVLGIWFASQFFIGAGQQAGGGVAWLAHVGGFVAGVVLIFVFGGWSKRPRPSFDPYRRSY
ncbi:MAG: rhomboid family intramembrane serine protease [Actinomycetota bacterium]|nr:rhomboid family intramembrane serine protease [Actinomycetota bacterium]